MRFLLPLLFVPLALASCVPSHPAAQPVATPPPVAATPALPAAPPQQDWRDVSLTPGRWTWQGSPGTLSSSRFGLAGQAAAFSVRCDFATRTVVLTAPGATAAAMTLTTSFGTFALPASAGAAELGARDARLDRIAFSRGRFLVDMPGRPQLVLPAWPEVARVIEDCRG